LRYKKSPVPHIFFIILLLLFKDLGYKPKSAWELIYGALNKKELNQIKKDLNNLILVDIDKKTCDIFLELLTKYALSHKLAVPDGFIAATALANNIQLFTLNLKDYRFIDGLKLYKR